MHCSKRIAVLESVYDDCVVIYIVNSSFKPSEPELPANSIDYRPGSELLRSYVLLAVLVQGTSIGTIW
eukprot:scaffold64505_cov35-Prasinocladus_malaysianus.AAC.4